MNLKRRFKWLLRGAFGDFRGEAFVLGMVVGFLLFMFVAFRPFTLKGQVSGRTVNGDLVVEGVGEHSGYVRIDGWVRSYTVGDYPFWRENLTGFRKIPAEGENSPFENLLGR